MKRIIVIGSGGSGKSTLAAKLGQLLNLEVIHLDKLFWKSGWVEPPRDEWLETVTQLVSRDSWIIDGNYSGTLEVRIQKCDTIVFLDLSRLLCLWRIVRRNLQYRRSNRPDMAEGCPEKLDLGFMSWIWNYQRRSRPKVVELIRTHAEGKRVIWLRSKADVKEFLSVPRRERGSRSSTGDDQFV